MVILVLVVEVMKGMNIGDVVWIDGEYWCSIFCDEQGCGENYCFVLDLIIVVEVVYCGLIVLFSCISFVDKFLGFGCICDLDICRFLVNFWWWFFCKDDNIVEVRC